MIEGSRNSSAVKKRLVAKPLEECAPLNLLGAEDVMGALHTSSVSFFTWGILQTVIVHCFAGALFGYGIGFVGPYYTLYKMGSDCMTVTTQSTCPMFIPEKCTWKDNACKFVVDNCSGQLKEACGASSSSSVSQTCYWNHKTNVCQPMAGFTALQNGIFAGAFIFGGCIGSLISAPLLSVSGHRITFLLCGFVGTVGGALTHFATYTDSYMLLVAGRFLTGVSAGVLCVSSPAYVEETAPIQHRQLVGVFFQIACTFGILSASAMGLGLAQRSFSTQHDMQQRQQMFCLPGTIIALLMMFISGPMRESVVWMEQRHLSRPGEQDDLVTFAEGRVSYGTVISSDPKPGWGGVKGQLLTALVLCIAQQLTGMNAIMNYAPIITDRMGLEPLFGNFVVMAWNFITVLTSIPISSRAHADRAYVVALLLASLSCLLVAVAVLPFFGFSSNLKVKLSATGILLFITFFELGMGSFFWTLSQGIFPPNFRHRGSSFTVLVHFLINIVINVGFPLAVEWLSGGPSGNQDVGMGIAFLFFGIVGLLSTAYLHRHLRLWQSS
ncbi:glucose transporter, putative [Trypanosoma equiperdum]|uniref:Glucose transporter, putative n=2 Tax=Trypanozoon TaxID=39700 RepID=Q584F8_TRYB2|nr:glucose transporter, putative [Trypanosoma brucei brucei TREU927]AAX79047.1 glucose transporter, putative [Trypanosoma brucei]AAZ10820.1 glucose transporter, putative [Trypanosoma brucei brucei TREU927]SCU68202.1 glucose transporter, putative [Trypanosoma equiperdum]